MAITQSDTRLTAALIEEYLSAGYWTVPTFPELLERNAREFPDRVGFVDANRRITWRELLEMSRQFAASLLDLGVARGDVVGVQLPNRIEFVVALGAINMIGAVICPYVTALRSAEAKFVLSFAKAVVAIVPAPAEGEFDLVAMTEALRPQLPELKHLVVVGGGKDENLSFEAMIPPGPVDEATAKRLRERAPGPHDINRILFTSGSTGDPKGVLHTYATTMYSNVRQNEHMRVDQESCLLLFIPITLNWGMFQIMQAALAPCVLVLQPDFKVEATLDTIERERVTHFGAPPTALIALLNSPSLRTRDLSWLKLAVTSGTSCPVELLKATRAKLGCPVMEGYGMTECGWICATTFEDNPEDAVGTVGNPFPWMLVDIVDDEGNSKPQGEVGEVTMSGPCICVGYYNNPERNAASWMNGRFRSGDLGMIDDTGRLRIVGRTKDIIKHGGSMIPPRELEEILFTHPKVSEVSVVAVPDLYFGENACACVIPEPGESLSLDELNSFLSGRIAKYKLPQRLELFDQFPYTSTGKVQKHILQKLVLERRPADIVTVKPDHGRCNAGSTQ